MGFWVALRMLWVDFLAVLRMLWVDFLAVLRMQLAGFELQAMHREQSITLVRVDFRAVELSCLTSVLPFD
ncbi:MAG: hypothetical protein ACI9BH_001943 [Paracoccaceae bacterium]|jgi:hypothetical protein